MGSAAISPGKPGSNQSASAPGRCSASRPRPRARRSSPGARRSSANAPTAASAPTGSSAPATRKSGARFSASTRPASTTTVPGMNRGSRPPIRCSRPTRGNPRGALCLVGRGSAARTRTRRMLLPGLFLETRAAARLSADRRDAPRRQRPPLRSRAGGDGAQDGSGRAAGPVRRRTARRHAAPVGAE